MRQNLLFDSLINDLTFVKERQSYINTNFLNHVKIPTFFTEFSSNFNF